MKRLPGRPARWALGLLLALPVAALAAVAPQTAPAEFDVRANYTKQVYMIPMRDGVKLYTVVYSPKDTSAKYPIMLDRTPYSVGPYGEGEYKESLGPSENFSRGGYIFAYQDVRGKYMSEGEYADIRPQLGPNAPRGAIDESTDTYDTIDYLVKNVPNNNGRVGMWGISYPGFYTAVGTIDAHPALKAASPQAPVSEWFIGDDFHHNGAFFMFDAFRFYASFGRPRPNPTTESAPGFDFGMPDAYRFFLEMGPLRNADEKYFKGDIKFWDELMAHPNYDAFWQARSLEPHLRDIKPAIMTVGGWFDAEDLYGALHVYDAIERQSPKSPRNMLVMGPWYHGGWARSEGDKLGDIRFDAATAEYYRNEVEFPFFEYYLKDKGTLDLPEAVIFNTGANEWRKFAAWPPKNLDMREIYFGASDTLSFERPAAKGQTFDEYVSDPANPVPHTAETTNRRSREYMTEDQRFASRRPDVLAYRGDVLTEDLTIAGPITVDLFASTTGTDADFVVKLIDVYPDDTTVTSPEQCAPPMGGYEMLLRWEIMRGRFRNSYSKPAPFVPGKVTPVRLTLNDVCHTFKKGHRIMIQVQSSMFPLIDRNPQKFVDIYTAKESNFQKATIRVYRSARYPSHVTVGVME